MNLIEIAGHLGADPETRFTPNGQKVTSMRVATNMRKGGRDETIWWRVTVWGDRFDKMLTYMKKGSAIIVVGELNPPEVYTDKQGQQRVSLEIRAEMLRFSPFGRNDRAEGNSAGGNYGSQPQAQTQSGFGEQTYQSEQPFEFATGSGGASANSNLDEDPIPF